VVEAIAGVDAGELDEARTEGLVVRGDARAGSGDDDRDYMRDVTHVRSIPNTGRCDQTR
jgi:hypothetical protein